MDPVGAPDRGQHGNQQGGQYRERPLQMGRILPVTDGQRVFAAHGGRLLALDAGTGQRKWEYAAQAPIIAPLAVAEGAIYVYAEDGQLHALEAKGGQQRWSNPY